MVTHDSTVARRAQRIGTMRNGRLTIKSTGRKNPGRAAQTAAGTETSDTTAIEDPPDREDPGDNTILEDSDDTISLN